MLNDRLLKGAGVLPSWLVGKLSDLAGLVVAPVWLVVVMRLRSRRARLVAFAMITAVFSAVKLSAAAALWVEQLTRRAGVPWRLWPDPTDLVALIVLPLAWKAACARPGLDARVLRSGGAEVRRLVGVALGALACMATSVDESVLQLRTFLVNATVTRFSLRLYRARPPLDCATVAERPEASLTPTSFVLESCPVLEPEQIWPLSAGPRLSDSRGRLTGADAGAPPPCEVVAVEAPGLEPIVLSWGPLETVQVRRFPDDLGDLEREPRAVFLERVGARVIVESTALIRATKSPVPLPPDPCPFTGEAKP